MTYFTRFTTSKEQAQADLERGFSFDGYLLLEEAEDVLDFFGIEYDDLDEAIEEYGLAQDNGEMAGWWGKALDGLCGFQAESLEEAHALIEEKRGVCAGGWQYAAIYTGSLVGSVYDGDLFRPQGLVEVVEL